LEGRLGVDFGWQAGSLGWLAGSVSAAHLLSSSFLLHFFFFSSTGRSAAAHAWLLHPGRNGGERRWGLRATAAATGGRTLSRTRQGKGETELNQGRAD